MITLLKKLSKFYCHLLLLLTTNCSMQNAYRKTSISIPKDVLAYLKAQSRREDGMPVSRLISRAVRLMMEAKKK